MVDLGSRSVPLSFAVIGAVGLIIAAVGDGPGRLLGVLIFAIAVVRIALVIRRNN
jgi:hypothetical protein